ncbi:MAG: DNRLRE domain-containing protein, partial [Chloroflexi bacterium]|nr:DNRLRE domain-containing protein [Chloroflexota bacterium]
MIHKRAFLTIIFLLASIGLMVPLAFAATYDSPHPDASIFSRLHFGNTNLLSAGPIPLDLAASATAWPASNLQTLVFQNGVSPAVSYDGTSDAIITTWNGNNYANLGGLDYLQVGESGDTDQFRFLIRFDLQGWLPPAAWITEAWLEIRSYDGGFDDEAQDVVVHQVRQAWVEGNGQDLFADGREEGVTWVTARPGVSWTTPGGDFDTTALDRVRVAANSDDWQRWDVTTAVQAWLADPSANLGLLLEPDAAPWTHHEFRASEYATPSLRPRLRLSFTVNALFLPF